MKYHKSFHYISLSPASSIILAISYLEKDSSSTVFVVDEMNRLLGTIADGDIRRALLAGQTLDLDAEVASVMNKCFVSLPLNHTYQAAEFLINQLGNLQVPVLRDDKSIEYVYTPLPQASINIPVVIMAGGRGARLKPLTDTCPKPMLPINGTPMLELIINNLILLGVKDIYISVNYLKDVIIDYFGDGTSRGISIYYLQEDEPLGTAGSLSLLPHNFDSSFLVINADILSRIDYRALYSYYKQFSPDALMCIRTSHVQVPFGVVQHDGHIFLGVKEKPSIDYMVNTGVYILSPKVLKLIPNSFFNMPYLFELMYDNQYDVHVYPLYEDWYDVGVPSSLDTVSLLDWH